MKNLDAAERATMPNATNGWRGALINYTKDLQRVWLDNVYVSPTSTAQARLMHTFSDFVCVFMPSVALSLFNLSTNTGRMRKTAKHAYNTFMEMNIHLILPQNTQSIYKTTSKCTCQMNI